MQMWSVVDAVQLLDQLAHELQAISPEIDAKLAAAKTAHSQGHLEQAIEILIAGMEAAAARSALQVPTITTLRALLERAGSHIDEQDRRIDALERQVASQQATIRSVQTSLRSAEADRDRAVRARQRAQQQVFLGQAAYTLASLVEAFVFQGAPTGELTPLSLTQMDKKARRGGSTCRRVSAGLR